MSHRADSHASIERKTLLLDIATCNVIRLAPNDSVGEAARIMTGKRISSIVVTDRDGHPLGIITERNILQAMQSGCAPETALQNVMSSPVITVPDSMTCLDAYQVCLRDGIRHLVIVDEDKLMLGVVSETDFRQHINLTALAGHRQIASAMSRSVFSLPPDAGLLEALNFMQSHRDACVVVVDAERPVGIITERDIVRLYSGKTARTGITIGEVMTSPVLSMPLDNTINEAAERMITARVRHLVVVDHAGRLAGLLSEHDLTHAMTLSLIGDSLIAEGAFLHTLINTLPDLVWLKDADGVYLSCNQRFERFFGAQEKDIAGKTDYDFVSKELADFFREHDRIAMEKGAPSVNEEWVVFADDGHRELLETIKMPMRDGSGKLIGILGIGRDISQRKLNEEKLLEQNEFLDSIFESALDAFVLMDSTGAITGWSSQAEKIFGWKKDEAIGLLVHETIAPVRYRKDHVFGLEKFLLTGEGPALNAKITLSALHRDGHEFPIELSISSIKTARGYVFSAFISDITERKRLEQQLIDSATSLRQSEEKLRSLIDAIPDPIQFKDGEGRWVESNLAARQAFGLENVDCTGRTDEYLSEIAAPAFRQALLQCHQTDEQAWQVDGILHVEEIFPLDDGSELFFDVIKKPLFHEDRQRAGLLIVGRDITALRQSQEALEESEKLFRTIFEQSSDGIELTSVDTLQLVEVNPAACRMLGYTHEEYLRLRLIDTQADLNEAALKEAISQLNATEGATFEHRHRCKNGDILNVEVNARMLDMPGKRLLVGVWRDITERKRAEANLRTLASVFDNSLEAIMITSADNTVIDVNLAFTRVTGYGREEVLGRDPKFLSSDRQDKAFYARMWHSIEQKKNWRGEIWNRRKSGEIYAELLSISAICNDDGSVQRYVAVFSDISYLKEHEAELSRVANYDALTGVPNRRLFADRLWQAIARAKRSGMMLAIGYIDLDGFKQVNDLYGHEAGDHLLIEVTRRIQETLRGSDTLARLGGDEFVVLFSEVVREQECLHVLDRILDVIAMPVFFGKNEINVSASIGVTFYPADDEDGDTLLRHADQAMYIAKQTGKNRYHLYDAKHDQRVRSLHESRQRILQGLKNGEFELFYQPKIELVSGELMGVEALIRWHHPERGLLLPVEFLPFIEDSELEIQLGEWVMDAVLAQIDVWYKMKLVLEVSINISAHHLQSPDFVAGLARKLALYPDLPRDKLQIEVLETTALDDIIQSAKIIEDCRKLGISFALDDFGTGYSSLSYLRKLSAETLKIDQSFVRGMLTNEGDRAIVQGIIALARAFGRKTVAEGIEAPELIQILIEVGCMFGQGYGIAKPMSAGDFLEWQQQKNSPERK